MKKTISAIGVMVLAGAVVYGWNFVTLIQPVRNAVAADVRNQGVTFRVHYQQFLNPTVLTFDLRSVTGEKTPADVFRVFLQSADALKQHDFRRIELQYRGQVRFVILGSYFKELGTEFSSQNPLYTMRTFTAHVLRPDGSKAFPGWTGGWLGVLQKEMEQFAEFHRQWYLSSLAEGK